MDANKMITVGRLRDSVVPNDKGKTCSTMLYMAKAFDIDLFLFEVGDVDYYNKTINGHFFESGRWIRKVVPIPPLIDNEPGCFDDILLEHAFFTRRLNVPSKYETYKYLYRNETYRDFLIPTALVNSVDDVLNAFKRLGADIVLKPDIDAESRGLFSISKKKKGYFITSGTETKAYTEMELSAYLSEAFTRKYIMQPMIQSRTKDGSPFDIRLRCANYGGGYTPMPYARVGNPEGITSYSLQSGNACTIEFFLKQEFGDKWWDVLSELMNLGRQLPLYYEKFFDNLLFEIGIDIGISKTEDGHKFYLFEANSFPNNRVDMGGGRGIDIVIAYFRYFHYLYKNFINKP